MASINTTAPGVYSKIVDLSDYVDTVPSSIAFLPIICEKGPDNTFVRITRSSFIKTFGEPNLDYTKNASYGMGPYVLWNYLQSANNAYTIRCLPDDATFAHLAIRTSGFDATGSAGGDSTSGDTSGTYVMDFYPDYIVEGDDTTLLNSYKDIESLIHSGEIDTDVWTFDGSGANDPAIVVFYGVGRGSYYNDFQIDLSPHPRTELQAAGLYILDIYKKQQFSKRFASSSDVTYTDYELVESFEVSFDPDAKDSDAQSQYIVDVVNTFSNDIRCIANETYLAEIARRANLSATGSLAIDRVTADFSLAFENDGQGRWRYITVPGDDYDSTSTASLNSGELLTYGISLSGGSEGSLFILDEVGGLTVRVINDDTTSGGAPYVLSRAYEGILKNAWITLDDAYDADDEDEYVAEVLDTQFYPIDVVFDAGYPYTVKDSIVRLVNTRRDCVAILDNGDNKTPNRAIKARKTDSSKTASYNSEYVAIYEQYSKYYDSFTGKFLWVPPSYHMAQVISVSDSQNEVWAPLAGFRRAVINNIKDVRYTMHLGDREEFANNQLNPLVLFDQGFTFFSEYTSKKTRSALQELHIMRLVLYIQRALEKFCMFYVFELNDDITRNQIKIKVNEFLRDVQSRRGLESFSTTVTASEYDIKTGKVQVNVTLKPVRAIQQIFLNFQIV